MKKKRRQNTPLIFFHHELLLSLTIDYSIILTFTEIDISISSWGPILSWYSVSFIESERPKKKSECDHIHCLIDFSME